MLKNELLEIASHADLVKYQESKEYKAILESCDIKQEAIKQEILSAYQQEEVAREEEFDFHDKQFAYLEFLKLMLEKIKSTSKWAEALRVEIQNEIKYTETGIGTRAMNEFGIAYSASKLTKMDMKRVNAGNFRTFYTILNGLVNTVDVEQPKNEDIY